MKIGVHVSIGKGLAGAIVQAKSIGCDGFQIFAGNPRGWARKPLQENEITNFREERKHSGLWPVVVHLAYLPNLASENDELYEKSVQLLAEDFQRANNLGADFFVFHPGKNKNLEIGLERICAGTNLVLEKINGPTTMLFENQAGAGGEIAGQFHELGLLLKTIKAQSRIGVCFDTCHAFAAGYDLREQPGWDSAINEFEREIGINYLKMFHLNDCHGSLGSHLDRHQHIGSGNIGLEGFRYLVNHPQLSNLPGILETPQDNPDDDLKNLATLRGMMREKN